MAITIERNWHKQLANAMKPSTVAKIKCFDEKSILEAKEWISKPKS